MKLETIVTAIIFLCVGFFAGYFYQSQKQAAVPVTAAASAAASAPAGGAGMGSAPGENINPATGLPAGHPPMKVSELIKNYAEQARKNPQDPQIPLRLANYLYDQKLYGLAIQWYQKALSIAPDNINARTDLGTAYFYSGQSKQALTEYHEVLKTAPHHQPTLFNLIVVNLEGTHDYPAAQRYWKDLDQRNPQYPGLQALKQKLDAARGTAAGKSQ